MPATGTPGEPAPFDAETVASVLVATERPPRPSALAASPAFGRRAVLKIEHVPYQLFDVTAFPTMPGRLQAFVNNNPVTHLASAVRGLTAGQWPGVEIAWTLAWAGLLLLVFGPVTMRLYNRK
ncbi:ABC transporter permease [Streptomyces sp. NPDC005012]|uniref:ABC transporter permease n=1 Tax=unclassified Streptomyces TaxID=2593676 RepID=UPI0033B719CF